MSLSDTSDDSWVTIRRYAKRSDAEGAALTLASAGISSQLLRQGDGVLMFVASVDALRAARELADYDRENSVLPAPPLPSVWLGVDAALAYALILFVAFVAAGRSLFGFDWETAGYADSGLIIQGEWWRALTALTLHADLGHLASNTFAGGVLGILLAQVMGPGLAWLAILVAGGIGNTLSALVQPAPHASIGASTSVFAALGMLAVLMWRRRLSYWQRSLRAWAPLASGVMLLVFLGFGGDKTDVGAHVSGFLVGCVVGAGFHFFGASLPSGRGAQYAYGIAALALIGLAWIVALTAGAAPGA